MSRTLSVLVLFVAIVTGAAAQNDAVYIYRNDGTFNAFFKDEIDSITYSHYGTDSLYHREWEMQVVYTQDSVYRIPLAAIDSVSFQAPETIVNKEVFELTAAHDPYLSGCDTVSFTLAPSTPSAMRPAKDNIVVSTYDCMSFPDGIMAKVLSVSVDGQGYHYNCRRVGLESVYDQLVCIAEGYIDDGSGTPARSRAETSWQRELWDRNYSGTLEKGGTTTRFSVDDAARMVVTVNIQIGKAPYFQLDLQNDLKTKVDFKATSSFEKYYEKQIARVTLGRIWIPQCPLLFITPRLTLSAYFAEGATVSLDCQAHYNRTDKVSFICEDNVWRISHAPANDAGVDVASLSMDGYAEVGVIPDLLFSLCGSATGLGVESSVGLKESVDFKFDAVAAFDEGAYAALKESRVRTTLPQSFRAYASVGLWGDGVQPASCKYSVEPQLGVDKRLLPAFTMPVYTQGAMATTAVLKSEVSGDLLLPVRIGIAFYDEDDALIEKQYKPVDYITESQWSLNGLECTFRNMEAGKTYTAYPIVKIMNKELRAVPSAEFPELHLCPDDNHPHAIDLGLPSGTKWACCNVGATVPEGYGGYYAWGETYEKSEYTEENCTTWGKAMGDISGNPQHDVACARWGGNWRMPTSGECEELCNQCVWTWVSVNGNTGHRVTGPSGGSIFLPAAGFRNGSSLYGAGSYGFYWSSTPNESDTIGAYELNFGSGSHYVYYTGRGYGQPVRSVSE